MRVALLHGFAGGPWAWDDVIAAWPAPPALAAIALPGHGAPIGASWDDNLERVARAIDGADVVVGYSLGARVALGLSATGRIARAVLIGVNPGIDDADRPARRAHDARWAARLRTEGLAAFVAAWAAQPLFATQARVPAERRAARDARRRALDPEGLARSLETMGLAEMPDYRQAARDGVALVVGADDLKYLAIARALGRGRIETIADAGHDPTFEQPARLAAVLARLTRTAPAARRGS